MSEDPVVDAIRHSIDRTTADVSEHFSRTDISTALAIACLQGQCGALENETLLNDPAAREYYIAEANRVISVLLGES